MSAIVWLAGAAVIGLPGLALARLFERRVRVATVIGCGLAFWPVLFLWTSTIGLAWNAWLVRAIVLLCVAPAIGPAVKMLRGQDWLSCTTLALFALVCVTRVLHIRGIALPPWVDSVHHTMIVRLLLEHGTIPESYAPFIAGGAFSYHWGFHVVVAAIAWLTGMTAPLDVARILLWFGQLLNALVFAAVYEAGRVLLRSRRGGLLAAVLATLVSYFPAYYVSWGRYTHLAGVVILVPLSIALFRNTRRLSMLPHFAARCPLPVPRCPLPVVRHFGQRVQRATGNGILPLALFASGLVLVHVRVAVLALTLAIAMLATIARRRWRFALRSWSAAAILVAIVTCPWLVTLADVTTAQPVQWAAPNVVPDDLLWAPNNVPLLIAGTWGLAGIVDDSHISVMWRVLAIVWLLLLLALSLRRERFRRGSAMALLLIWSALTFLSVNADLFGLPRLRAIPNSALIITMFLPLSLAGAAAVTWLLGRRPRALSSATVVLAIAGASTMTRIVNPRTVLARDADVRAMRWIAANTPRDATFAVGVQPWIGGAFVGIDGGYWIPVLTDRRSILPPGLYTWVMPPADAGRTNAMLARWAESDALDPSVTHIYFGPSNDSPLRERLRAMSTPVYDVDGVTIFRVGRECHPEPRSPVSFAVSSSVSS